VKNLRHRSWPGVRDREYTGIIPLPTEPSRSGRRQHPSEFHCDRRVLRHWVLKVSVTSRGLVAQAIHPEREGDAFVTEVTRPLNK
jgi:hypothetical protein